jgi:predicted metal-dependent HD superfamily phosphohydrolase
MRDRRPALVDTASECWGELLTPRCPDPAAVDALFGELLQRLQASDRWPNNLRRLVDTLGWIERLEHRAHDPYTVRLTAWAAASTSDISAGDTTTGDTTTGDTTTGDTANRVASASGPDVDGARWAVCGLGRAGVQPALLTGVERLLGVLPEHDPVHGDADAEVLCDADWAVLGAPATEYRDHVDELRRESTLPEAGWSRHRLLTVRELLGRDSVFRTPEMRAAREGRAQLNIAREAAGLRAAGSGLAGAGGAVTSDNVD